MRSLLQKLSIVFMEVKGLIIQLSALYFVLQLASAYYLECLRKYCGVETSKAGESSPFLLGMVTGVRSGSVRRHFDDLISNELKYGAFENIALPISLQQGI